ncbi:MAG: isoprenylcysteine carboxylmethyltransferase family protein [Alphaproteobacteria bacterium]|nr:isoprenylcysteine carboxylmethyltransferase family protein [Alphaproteobacteria bacterium]
MKTLWKNAIDMPPVWLLVFLAAVWGQARAFNPANYSGSPSYFVGWFLILLGLGVATVSIAMFRRHKTTVIPKNVPTTMITSGPYRYSRNPIYLADAMILLGFIILKGSVLGLITLPIFMLVIQSRFIHGEEAGLAAEFPDQFKAFCGSTRRWI